MTAPELKYRQPVVNKSHNRFKKTKHYFWDLESCFSEKGTADYEKTTNKITADYDSRY